MSVVYHKRYFINFMGMPDENSSGRSYRVEFYKRGDSADAIPGVVELQGSGSPFLQSLNDSEDLLAPLRTSTARISFIDDISLQELSPKDAFEWQVRLLRLDDGKQLFIGYLTAEVYTQPNIEGPNVVTVNAASPLTPIAATTMQLVDVGSLSIGRLLHMALSECEGVDSVYIPAMYTINKATSLADFTDILHWQFSSSNFIKTSDSGVVTGELFECDTYSAALEAICKLFGWSLTDVGDGSLYFVSPGYTGRYMQIGKYQLLASGFVPTVVSPTIIDEGYLFPVDASNTIDFRQGVGSAVVKVTATTSELSLPDPESLIDTYSFARETVELTSAAGEEHSAEVAEVTTTLRPLGLKLFAYALTNDNKWVELENFSRDIINEELQVPYDKVGVEFSKFDWANPEDLKENAENPKRAWSLTDAYRIKEAAEIVDISNLLGDLEDVILPDDKPIMSFYIQGGIFNSGAFVVDFQAMASPKKGFFIPEDSSWQGGDITEPTKGISAGIRNVNFPYWGADAKALRVSLKVGNKYYNGDTWQDSKAIFSIPISADSAQWHIVKSNKTIDMPYGGDSGWYIPIPELLSGNIELSVYKSFTDSETVKKYGVEIYPQGTIIEAKPLVPLIYIKGFSLKHEAIISRKNITEADVTFYKSFKGSFKEQKEVSLPLHSRINSSEQMSLVFDGFSTAIDTVWRTTATEAAKPERFLLANIERLYSRPLTSWRTASSLREVTPFDMFSKPDGVLPLMGYTINYAVGVIELHLTKVESEKELRYVE